MYDISLPWLNSRKFSDSQFLGFYSNKLMGSNTWDLTRNPVEDVASKKESSPLKVFGCSWAKKHWVYHIHKNLVLPLNDSIGLRCVRGSDLMYNFVLLVEFSHIIWGTPSRSGFRILYFFLIWFSFIHFKPTKHFIFSFKKMVIIASGVVIDGCHKVVFSTCSGQNLILSKMTKCVAYLPTLRCKLELFSEVHAIPNLLKIISTPRLPLFQRLQLRTEQLQRITLYPRRQLHNLIILHVHNRRVWLQGSGRK